MGSTLWILLFVVLHFLLIGADPKSTSGVAVSSSYGQISFYPSPSEENTKGFKPSKNLSLFDKWKDIRKKKRPKLKDLAKSSSPKVLDIFKPFASQIERRKYLRSLRKKRFPDSRTTPPDKTNFRVFRVPLKEKSNIEPDDNFHGDILHLRGRVDRNISFRVTEPPIHMFPPPLIPIRFLPKTFHGEEEATSHFQKFSPHVFTLSSISVNEDKPFIIHDNPSHFQKESAPISFPPFPKNNDLTTTNVSLLPTTPRSSISERSKLKKSPQMRDSPQVSSHLNDGQRTANPPRSIASSPRPKLAQSKPKTRKNRRPKSSVSNSSKSKPDVADTPTALSEILGNKFHSGVQVHEARSKLKEGRPTSTTFKITKLQNLYHIEEDTQVHPPHDRPAEIESNFNNIFENSNPNNNHLQNSKDEPSSQSHFQLPNFNTSSYSSFGPISANGQTDSPRSAPKTDFFEKPHTTFVNGPTFKAVMAKPKGRLLRAKLPPFSQSPFHPRPPKPPSVAIVTGKVPTIPKSLHFPNTASHHGNFVHSQTFPAGNRLTSPNFLQNTLHPEDQPLSFRERPKSRPQLGTPLQPANTGPSQLTGLKSPGSRPHSWTHVSFTPTPPPSFFPSPSLRKERTGALQLSKIRSKLQSHKLPAVVDFHPPPPIFPPPPLPLLKNIMNQSHFVQSFSHSASAHLAVPSKPMKAPPWTRIRRPNVIQDVPTRGMKTHSFSNNLGRKKEQTSKASSVFASRPKRKHRIKPSQPYFSPTRQTIDDQQVATSNTKETQKSYEYHYVVEDPTLGLEYGHKERRSGGSATGEYFVTLADGRTQHVKYVADEHGYRADVKFYDAKIQPK